MTERFAPAQVIAGRYEVGHFLRAGGMQEVYVAYDHTLERAVVIKTPKQGTVDKRFSRGAQMGARVTHPNVAATLDYVEDEGVRCVVEELIEGSDLGHLLESEFHFVDPALAAHLLHHIVKGLQAAHVVGIAHRDMKPSNIMIGSDESFGTVKLTDFGIAKLAEQELEAEIDRFEKDNNTLTSSNTLLGAVPYMAPECWSSWAEAGQPIDIWAFGCIAYHMLSGVPPFGVGRQAIRNVTIVEHAGRVDLARPRWFGLHRNTAKLEDGLWSIIQRCLQIDPAARPSAAEVVQMFDELCYATAARQTGSIEDYLIRYPSGGTSRTGYIRGAAGGRWFFHESEFYGTPGPQVGQRVSFSVYPGLPNHRCSPVLLLRDALRTA